MKRLLWLLMLAPLLACSQINGIRTQWDKNFYTDYGFVEVGVDARNAIIGSDKNSSGFDGIFRIGASHGHTRLALFYETFDLIGYESYGIQPSFILNPGDRLQFLTGTEISIINRGKAGLGTTISYALNGEIEYHFERFYIGTKADLKRATDIQQAWRFSGLVKIGLKL